MSSSARINQFASDLDVLIDRFEEQNKLIDDFKSKNKSNIFSNTSFRYREEASIRNNFKEINNIYEDYFKRGNITEEDCYNSLVSIKDKIEKDLKEYEDLSNKEMNGLKKCRAKGGDSMEDNNGRLKFVDSNGNTVNALYKGQKISNNFPNKSKLDLGKYMKGAITGNWDNAVNELNAYKSLSTSTGQVLIPKDLCADILDNARNMIVLGDVPVVLMDSNNLTIAKIDKDPVFAFKEEYAEADISDMTFGQVDFKAKTAYGLMKISLELFHSAQNINQVIGGAISASIARMIDEKGLYGTGGVEPNGILTLDSINRVNGGRITESRYAGFVKGLGAIRRANGEPTSMAYNATIDEEFNLLEDSVGVLFNKPEVLSKLDRIVSNQVKDNQAIVYDKNSIAIGLQQDISIEIDNRGMGFKDGSIYIRVYAMLDVQALYPENISLITFEEENKKSKTK